MGPTWDTLASHPLSVLSLDNGLYTIDDQPVVFYLAIRLRSEDLNSLSQGRDHLDYRVSINVTASLGGCAKNEKDLWLAYFCSTLWIFPFKK